MNEKLKELYKKIISLYDEKFNKDSPLFTELYNEYKKVNPNYGITRISHVIFMELKKKGINISPNYIYISIKIGTYNREHGNWLIKNFGIAKAEQLILKIGNKVEIEKFIKTIGHDKIKAIKRDDVRQLTSAYKYELPYTWKHTESLSQELRKQVSILNKYLISINLDKKTMEGICTIETELKQLQNSITKKLYEIEEYKKSKEVVIEGK